MLDPLLSAAFLFLLSSPDPTAAAPNDVAQPLEASGPEAPGQPLPSLDAALAPETSGRLAQEPPDNTLIWTWKDGLRFETADKRYRFKMGGRVHFDSGWFSGDDLKDAGISLEDADGFRRARLNVSGEFADGNFFKAEYDFAGGIGSTDARPGLTDVYVGRKDVLPGTSLQVGHFKEPFSLEQLVGANYITFLERSLADTFVPARNNGVMASGTLGEEQATWAVGLFSADTDGAGNSSSDGGYAGTARLTWAPVYQQDGARVVHVGAAYSMRDEEGVQYKARPEARLLGTFLDTGTIDSDDVDLLGAEAACVVGPFSLQGEYIQASTSGNTEADLSGWYAEASWFLTGEHRVYKRSEGVFSRVTPRHPTTAGGHGAWQVAVRASNLDFTDSAVDAGELNNLMLGLNWHMNSNMRMMLNYGLADLDDPGVPVDDSASMLMLRLQADW